jgi:hypothetical protein
VIKVLKLRFFLLMMLLFVSACSSNKQQSENTAIITVDLSYQPQQIKVGEETTLQALVKQGEELVADAQDVQFEVWKDGQQKHDMVVAESKGKGVYSAVKQFQDSGKYHVMYHVTARGMHSMKQQDVTVNK